MCEPDSIYLGAGGSTYVLFKVDTTCNPTANPQVFESPCSDSLADTQWVEQRDMRPLRHCRLLHHQQRRLLCKRVAGMPQFINLAGAVFEKVCAGHSDFEDTEFTHKTTAAVTIAVCCGKLQIDVALGPSMVM
jgi:hypothetical protein